MSRNILPSIRWKTKEIAYSLKEFLFVKHGNTCKLVIPLASNDQYHGGCSSVVEQRIVAPLAAGSIPVTRPKSSTYVELFLYRADSPDSAQWFSCSIWREACMSYCTITISVIKGGGSIILPVPFMKAMRMICACRIRIDAILMPGGKSAFGEIWATAPACTP